MTNLSMWTLIVGAVLPALIATIQQPGWSPRLRSIVTVAVCVVVGGGTSWLTGDLHIEAIVTSILTVLVAALSTYKGFWKPTGIAPTVEALTSGTTVPPPAV